MSPRSRSEERKKKYTGSGRFGDNSLVSAFPTMRRSLSGRRLFLIIAVTTILVCITQRLPRGSVRAGLVHEYNPGRLLGFYPKFSWTDIPENFPAASIRPLPTAKPKILPRIQHEFVHETAQETTLRTTRLAAVKGNFSHAWKGYKNHAWLRDEVRPLSGGANDGFGGWAATLVDSLGIYSRLHLLEDLPRFVANVQSTARSRHPLDYGPPG